MKNFAVTICLSLIALTSRSQGIECGYRRVYCFDLDVTGFNPYTDIKYQHIIDPEFEKQAIADREIWRGLHFATPGYKSPLRTGETSSGRVMFDLGNMNDANPWMSKTCYGSPSQNYGFFAGDAEITASYVTQPPGAEWVDYILYGSVLNENKDGYRIEIKGINFRENEVLCNRFIMADNYTFVYNQANAMMSSFVQAFENSILPEYEKNKRDKSNDEEDGKVAIEPKFQFDKPSYTVVCESFNDKIQQMAITLTDCDGEPLKNKVLQVEVKKGSILEEKVKTNEEGIAEITYVAPEQSCTDAVRVSWKFKYPSGRKNKAEQTVQVKVKTPVRYLDAQIHITYEQTTYYPGMQDTRDKIWQRTVISGKLRCEIMRNRIQLYRENPQERSQCELYTHCPVLSGASNHVERDPDDITKTTVNERFPLTVGRDYEAFGYRWIKNEEKFVKTVVSNASGTNYNEGLNLEIKPYNPPSGTLVALSAQYVIWLTGGVYLDRALEKPEGNGTEMRWDDFKEKLVPVGGPYIIEIPYSLAEADHQLAENEIYDQLLISNGKALEDFLLNPVGGFSVSAVGKRYLRDEGMEYEGNITITINFNPEPEKTDPDWDNW